MAFQSLSEKLSNAFKKFRNKGKLTEADVKEGMREIKLALLEADVNFKVVREFVKTVSERAVGSDVLESLVPAQQIVKIVNEELTNIMGGSMVVESIFSVPGIGGILVDSITVSDYSLAIGALLFYSFISVATILIVDISYGIIDPRIRLGAKKS